MKLPSPTFALALPTLTIPLPLSSATYACNATAKTVVTTLNRTSTTSTLHMFQTLSDFAPDPNLCGVNATIGVPSGYKGTSFIPNVASSSRADSQATSTAHARRPQSNGVYRCAAGIMDALRYLRLFCVEAGESGGLWNRQFPSFLPSFLSIFGQG